ncbi:hypothetical protein H6P81_016235 [Aristolochia fimbriata]|uniref:Uncharacterized protein n=1 Tax=Aristolochia fimbriata TaxID=158543 RepID=A0AAV7E9T4_ARIFI|nr:hypothetical protein H6P81_016235 [Aristolochia fimbriata]
MLICLLFGILLLILLLIASSTISFLGLEASKTHVELNGTTWPFLQIRDAIDSQCSILCSSEHSVLGRHAVEPLVMKNPYHLDVWSRLLEDNERVYFLPDAANSSPPPSEAVRGSILLRSLHREAEFNIPRLLATRPLVGKSPWDLASFPTDLVVLPLPFFYEWASLLGRCREKLVRAGVIDAVCASMFTYGCDTTVVHAFLEAREGEFSISLWTCINSLDSRFWGSSMMKSLQRP